MRRRRFPGAGVFLLAALLPALCWLGGGFRFSARQERLWDTVRGGQEELWRKQTQLGVRLSAGSDKLRTGFIGEEWSGLSTTLGSLEAKRTAANPLWGIAFLEWFEALGLKEGDRIVIYSSSSFPSMLFSALAAAESAKLEVLLAVSLGSSTWGANREDFSWPMMYQTLLEGGRLKTRPAFYTLGGAGEGGGGLAPEAALKLSELSEAEGTPLFVPQTNEAAIAYKFERLKDFAPRLFISIGGSNANLGDSESAPEIPNGLLRPGGARGRDAGDGVIGLALSSGVPTLNILNIRVLALENGIPWDPDVFVKARANLNPRTAIIGAALFFAVLAAHKRWEWDDEEGW